MVYQLLQLTANYELIVGLYIHYKKNLVFFDNMI